MSERLKRLDSLHHKLCVLMEEDDYLDALEKAITSLGVVKGGVLDTVAIFSLLHRLVKDVEETKAMMINLTSGKRLVLYEVYDGRPPPPR